MEQIDDYTPHVNEIMEAVGEKVDRSEIEKELRTRIERNRLDMESAKRGIVRRYGGPEDYVPGETNTTAISDIKEDGAKYHVVGVVNSVRSIPFTKDGVTKTTTAGTIIDSSGSIDFKIWNEVKLEIGKTYRFRNCKYNDRYRNLSINSPNDVKLVESSIKSDPVKDLINNTVKIADITMDSKDKSIAVIINGITPKTVNTKYGPKDINKVTVSDDSGSITMTDWNKRNLNIGEYVVITNIDVGKWNDTLNVNFGRYSKVILIRRD